ncbi:MAG: hypothetical protein NZM12_09795, partial [Steroidobacteraceae bacterium]|nr:hypothetical protein [Steroidobacteraceae bacterium]
LTTDAPLNRAVTLALRAAEQGGARAALIAHADLPLLNTSAVQAFLALAAPADDARTAAIAPCQRADGTSLLWLPLPAPIAVDYGPGSFLRHVRSLLAVGYSVQVGPRQPDLDLPDDLGALLVSEALDPQSETAKVLAAVVAGREPGLVRGRHAQ